MEISKLLEVRKKAKKVKPTFVVKESNFSASVKPRWRFPRGKHSKVRQMHCGRPALPTPGYGSPKEVKGLHKSGLVPIRVCSMTDLLALDVKKEGAILSSKLGERKKLELLKVAKEKNVTLLDVNADEMIKTIETAFSEKKKMKAEKLKVKGKKVEEKVKRAEEKKQKEERSKTESSKQEDEEKNLEEIKKEKEEQKKEAEKVLTRRQ